MKKCKNPECNKEIHQKVTYCSFSCRSYYNNKYVRNYDKEKKQRKELKIEKYFKNPRYCKYCGKVLEYDKRNNIVCNISCSTSNNNRKRVGSSHNFSEKALKNIIDSNKKKLQKNQDNYNKQKNHCISCGTALEYKKRNRKTCSNTCYTEHISKLSSNNINCGGQTNYRKFEYKGILMDSNWEVQLAKWMDEHEIVWIRSKKDLLFNWVDILGKKRRYHPDFYLPKYDVYLDPKNSYLMIQDKYKLDYVRNIYGIVLYCGELEEIKEQIIRLLNKSK